MRRRILILALAGGGLAALLANFPLEWAAPKQAGVSYSGTIWNGAATGAPLFGDLRTELSPAQIFSASPLVVSQTTGPNRLDGAIGLRAAKDVRLRVNLLSLPMTDPRLQGLRGELNLRLDAAKWDSAGCTEAAGTAQTNVLTQNGGAIDWTGPELSGPISCEDGQFRVQLSGRDAGQNIAADLRLSILGDYAADITAATNRAEAGAVLPLFGFVFADGEYKLTEQGRWR